MKFSQKGVFFVFICLNNPKTVTICNNLILEYTRIPNFFYHPHNCNGAFFMTLYFLCNIRVNKCFRLRSEQFSSGYLYSLKNGQRSGKKYIWAFHSLMNPRKYWFYRSVGMYFLVFCKEDIAWNIARKNKTHSQVMWTIFCGSCPQIDVSHGNSTEMRSNALPLHIFMVFLVNW